MAKRSFFKLLLALFSAAPALSAAAPGNAGGENVFKQLQSLIGTWEGKFENGKSHTVTYRMTAGNTTLVETWTMSPTRESMTLYTMDGGALIATHFCPQGNAPRLQFVSAGEGGKLSFEFRDGANVQVKDKSHQHSFWIRLLGPNSFERSETYVANGSTPAEIAKAVAEGPVVYSRVK